eukprot:jgi/Ulvmu1/1169/UM107_0043.1
MLVVWTDWTPPSAYRTERPSCAWPASCVLHRDQAVCCQCAAAHDRVLESADHIEDAPQRSLTTWTAVLFAWRLSPGRAVDLWHYGLHQHGPVLVPPAVHFPLGSGAGNTAVNKRWLNGIGRVVPTRDSREKRPQL